MAAIGAFEKGRSKSAGINAIVREAALDEALSQEGFVVTFRHIAGKENVITDALSRLSEPGSGMSIPRELLALPRKEAPARRAGWWRVGGRPEGVLGTDGAEEDGVDGE